LASSIASGEINLDAAWAYRNHRNAIRFRQWFDKIGPDNPTQLEQEYVSTLRSGGFWDRGPTKLLRFIVIQGIGLSLAPVTGGASILANLGISAADSFFLDKIRLGFQPRYFIDDVRHRFFGS
jgi:hypothetical protein